jgi:hypothetical protein
MQGGMWQGEVKGTGTRHARDWFTEIWTQDLLVHNYLLQFIFATYTIHF